MYMYSPQSKSTLTKMIDRDFQLEGRQNIHHIRVLHLYADAL